MWRRFLPRRNAHLDRHQAANQNANRYGDADPFPYSHVHLSTCSHRYPYAYTKAGRQRSALT